MHTMTHRQAVHPPSTLDHAQLFMAVKLDPLFESWSGQSELSAEPAAAGLRDAHTPTPRVLGIEHGGTCR
jgi:hypothetical protein